MSGKIRQLVPFSLVIAEVVCLSSGDGYQSQTKLPHGQERTEPSSDNLIIHVDLVNVMFTVTDRKGKLVTDLARQNLKVHEDSKPQAISNFARETELPLTIAVRIDTSSSIRDRFKLEQEAAIDFVYKTLRPRKDKALLITFDSAVELVQDYTDNVELLAKAIR